MKCFVLVEKQKKNCAQLLVYLRGTKIKEMYFAVGAGYGVCEGPELLGNLFHGLTLPPSESLSCDTGLYLDHKKIPLNLKRKLSTTELTAAFYGAWA